MTTRGERDLSRIGVIDYLLMTIGACLAAFSGGMAIQSMPLALFGVQWVVLGAVVSYGVRALALRSPLIKLDSVLYPIAVLCAFIFQRQLNSIMPDGGFPRELIAAGWLIWMMILGSFATYQDSTLLFQAVPAIAMFGLVGCYDTFRNVTFAFFGFILCLATVFARAHGRQMLRQAADSGYFTRGLAPGTPVPEVETTPGLAQKMQAGPWRWVAGPEWALASALGIVLVSLLGAPVIKQSVQGVSGFVNVPIPRFSNNNRGQTSTSGAANQDLGGGVRIGQGPNRLTYSPVFEVRTDQLRYMRTGAFDTYTGRGWRFSAPVTGGPQALPTEINDPANEAAIEEMSTYREFDFSIRPRQPMRLVPVPGVLVGIPETPTRRRADGGLELIDPSFQGVLQGKAAEPDPQTPVVEAQRTLPLAFSNALSLGGLNPRVRDFALEVTANAKTDLEKAQAIKQAIARRIKYNINASAVPEGRDPIEWTLFQNQEGYCDVFASSMVMMARAADIPARYVVGYLPSSENRDPTGTFVVLESDAHAWAELYFKGVGWVVYDATEGADEVEGAGRGEATDETPWYQRGWFRTTLDGLVVITIGVGALFALRTVARQRAAQTPRTEVEREYATFSRLLERRSNRRRDLSRTPDEFLRETHASLGSAAPTASALNERFVRALYAPEPVDEATLAQIRADLRNFRQMLKNTDRETTARR